MRREVIKAVGWGVLFTAILALLIIVGSRNLSRFDAALVAYTFASLFAVFGITYRYAMWLQRPPTALYWKRGWQVFFRRSHFAGNLRAWIERVTNDFALNRFIWKRDPLRGLAHSLIMEAYLSGEESFVLTAAAASLVCLGLNLGLFHYLRALDR